MKFMNIKHTPVQDSTKNKKEETPSSGSSTRGRQRPVSGNPNRSEKSREKPLQRPKTSGGSHHSSSSSLNSDRPPSRQGRTHARDGGSGRGREGSQTVHGLGPVEAFASTGRTPQPSRPTTLPQNSWAVTQLGQQHVGEDSEATDDEDKNKQNIKPPPQRKGPSGGRKALSKSEKDANETLKQWLEGPQVDSDEYDTDLEDDFPPEPTPPIDFSGKFIYEKQCLKAGLVPVSYLVRNMDQGSLRMRHHYLGGTGTRPLAQALKENTIIEEIDLSDNYIEGSGAKALATVLKDNMFIVNLNISNNFIRSIGSDALCEMLEFNTTLKTLTLRGNQLADKDAPKLSEALRNNQSLVALDLSYNHFGEDGGVLISQGLAQNIALADLDLSWNCITRKGGVQLAKAIAKNQALEILDLSWNGISNTGAAALGVALKTNKSLRVLDISNNRISEEGAKKLGPGIMKNEGLETLLMGMNPIGSEGVKAILKGVNTNQRLRLAGLEDISMSAECHDKIKEITDSRDILIMYSTGAPQSNRINETILTVFERFVTDNADRMEDLFLQMDKSKTGEITLEEFKYGLKDFGLRLTSKQLDQLLDELDADKSGTIELQELLDGTVMVQQERAKQAVRAKEEKLLQDSVLMNEQNREEQQTVAPVK